MKKTKEYQDITITIPADIVEALSNIREVHDDFDFSMYITDGKVHFVDLVGYWDIDGNYADRTVDETWKLVRKFWAKAKDEVQFQDEVLEAKKLLDVAQANLDALEKKAKRNKWFFWK